MAECNLVNFVPMVAVTTQTAVPSIEFSTAKGNLERKQEVEDFMLDLSQQFTEGLEERDSPSSTPTGGDDPKHEVVEELSLDQKLPSVVTDAGGDTLAKDTESKKRYQRFPTKRKPQCVHSLSERPLIVRFVRRQKKQHEPGVEKNQRGVWMGLHILQKSET